MFSLLTPAEFQEPLCDNVFIAFSDRVFYSVSSHVKKKLLKVSAGVRLGPRIETGGISAALLRLA